MPSITYAGTPVMPKLVITSFRLKRLSHGIRALCPVTVPDVALLSLAPSVAVFAFSSGNHHRRKLVEHPPA